MAVAPFIRPIRVQGGTVYTFPSSVEDINFTFSNPSYDVTFSKFALLDIPNIATPENYENYVQLRSVPGAYSKVYDASSSANIAFANSLQDYAFNLETLIQSQDSYDSSALHTVSERVFFKWLKEIGALRFRESNASETSTNNTSTGQRFVEEDESLQYSRVIKYVGEVDLVNTSSVNGSTQAEIYIHVPTDAGRSPYVMFTSETKDTNYAANTALRYSPLNPLDQAYISGRTADDVQPSGLDTRAYYDCEGSYTDGSTYELYKKDSSGNYQSDSWWWPYTSDNTYFLEPVRLNDSRNDDLKIVGIGAEAGNDVYFRRSRLDGIGIDFDLTNYQLANQEAATNSWYSFNKTPGSTSFDFNTVLIYYDIVSKDDPTQKATNLFGVLFLDDLQPSTSGAYIPRFTKYRPNVETNMNGNSYGLRVNLRLDTNVEDTSVQSSINDYNTFSLQLFNEALTELRGASDQLLTQLANISLLQKRIDDIEEQLLTQNSVDSLDSRVTTLEQDFIDSQAYFSNSKSIIDLIQRNYDAIIDIYNNKTSVLMQYNVDVLTSGRGINLKKRAGKVEISNTRAGYSIDVAKPYIDLNEYSEVNSVFQYTHTLLDGSNYVLFKTDDSSPFDPNMDMTLLIDDSNIQFQSGQIIRICFSSPVNLQSGYNPFEKKFSIITDSTNRSGAAVPYSKIIGTFNASQFSFSGNQPYFEVVCLDPKTYTFNIEKIR
jgi:hypothetical protein